MPASDVPSLQGWTVAVTGARRGTDVVALLEQRGAKVVHAPAVQIVPLDDDRALHDATRACLAQPFDVVVVTTGVGLSSWLEAADGTGQGELLRRSLAAAAVYARGPKASGAVHASGLRDATSPPCESTWDILERLLSTDLRGRRVVVQLHGADLGDFTRALRLAGAEVLEVPVYRTAPPDDEAPLLRLVAQIVAREVQAVTFTSAAAAGNLLAAAARVRRSQALLDAFEDVIPVCVGPVAAAPLERLAVPTVQPEQARVGALVHVLVEALRGRGTSIQVAGHDLSVLGHGAVVDGTFRALPPAPMAALRLLAQRPGRVVPLAELRKVMPEGGEERAVEMAISRLRQGLGDARCVVNVIKRGYRLACELDRSDLDLVDEVGSTPAPLLASVGGTAGLRAAVELLYARLVEDPLVAHHFSGVDLPRLKRHQVLMLVSLLGGPSLYTGRSLAVAHRGLGITSEEYRRVLDHLDEVLVGLEAPAQTVTTVRDVLTSFEPDVVSPVKVNSGCDLP